MTNAAVAENTPKSEAIFTQERLFGLLVGGLCAPPIGLAGAFAATPIFDPTPGAINASPEAFAEALWLGGLMTTSILLVWGLLALGRRWSGIGPRSVLAISWCITIALLVYLLDASDGGFDGAVFHPVMILIVFMMWIISIPTALVLGSLSLAAAHSMSKANAVGLVAVGAIVALAVSLLAPTAPFNMGPDTLVGALGFWLPTGVFTMGCCAAASGARWP